MTSYYSKAIITATTNDNDIYFVVPLNPIHRNIIKANNTISKTSGPTDFKQLGKNPGTVKQFLINLLILLHTPKKLFILSINDLTDSGITSNIYTPPYTLKIQLTTSGKNLTISAKLTHLIDIFPKPSNVPVKTHLILSVNHPSKHIAFATYTPIS